LGHAFRLVRRRRSRKRNSTAESIPCLEVAAAFQLPSLICTARIAAFLISSAVTPGQRLRNLSQRSRCGTCSSRVHPAARARHVTLPRMFSAKLERRRQFHRLAIVVAVTVFVVGSVLIVIGAMRAFTLLEAADANSTPIILGIMIALACLLVLSLIAYGVVRAFGRFPSL
jgi:hypothetical protein